MGTDGSQWIDIVSFGILQLKNISNLRQHSF